MTGWKAAEPESTGPTSAGRAVVDTAGAAAALAEVNRAVEDLRAQLDAISALVHRAMAAPPADSGLDEMFLRAQEFTERTMAEAERGAAQILSRASEAAQELVEQARRQAMELAGRMNQYLVLSPEALKGLESSIERFTRANNEVTRDLSFLRN